MSGSNQRRVGRRLQTPGENVVTCINIKAERQSGTHWAWSRSWTVLFPPIGLVPPGGPTFAFRITDHRLGLLMLVCVPGQ